MLNPATTDDVPEEHSADDGEQHRWKDRDHGHNLDEDVHGDVGPVEDANQECGHDRAKKED